MKTRKVDISNNLRDECRKLVRRLNPDYFVTLTFRSNEVTGTFAKKTLRTFINSINREIFGRHSDDKISLLVFQEKNHSDGIHYHLLIQDPSHQTKRLRVRPLKQTMKKHWTKMRGSGYELLFSKSKWFQQVTNNLGISEYVTKTISTDTDAVDWELSNIPSNCLKV